jgi:hypothetical protein
VAVLAKEVDEGHDGSLTIRQTITRALASRFPVAFNAVLVVQVSYRKNEYEGPVNVSVWMVKPSGERVGPFEETGRDQRPADARIMNFLFRFEPLTIQEPGLHVFEVSVNGRLATEVLLGAALTAPGGRA